VKAHGGQVLAEGRGADLEGKSFRNYAFYRVFIEVWQLAINNIPRRCRIFASSSRQINGRRAPLCNYSSNAEEV